jgi:hypothetical protein
MNPQIKNNEVNTVSANPYDCSSFDRDEDAVVPGDIEAI